MNHGKAWVAVVPIILLAFGNVFLLAQQPGPAVTFEQTFHGSDPDHYVISISSDCRATYDSNGKLTDQSAADGSFHFDFTVTPLNCAKTFDLAKRSHYFEGEVDSKRKNIASTGIKILTYKDAQKTTKATYNYSFNPEIQALTTMFHSLSATMEFGRRLEYDRRYQKLALNEELKDMESLSSRINPLQEISAISPVLQKIIDDPSLMNVARARAQRLLAGAK